MTKVSHLSVICGTCSFGQLLFDNFTQQLRRQILLWARISYGDFVCPSVCLSGVSRPGTDSRPCEV